MPPLKNQQHELFCLALISGMSQAAAARRAGYSPLSARQQANDLITYPDIIKRRTELSALTESDTVMPVRERKERLSEIARARLVDFIDEQGNITLQAENNGALAEVVVTEWQGGKDERASSRNTRVKLHDPVKGIAELNKMEGEYPAQKIDLDFGKPFKELLDRLQGRPGPAQITEGEEQL